MKEQYIILYDSDQNDLSSMLLMLRFCKIQHTSQLIKLQVTYADVQDTFGINCLAFSTQIKFL